LKTSLSTSAAFVGLFFLCISTYALDPSRQISQYGHTAWRLQDGIFAGAPQSIAQTADGYLWIGTVTGLVRFDGVRFVPWNPPAGKALPSPNILSLRGGRDGSLWIGTASALVRWRHQELTTYSDAPGRINSIIEAQDGTIWMVRSRSRDAKGPLCRVNGEALRCYNLADGISFSHAETLADDLNGGVWIGGSSGLGHWTPGAVNSYSPEIFRHADGSTGVEALASLADGSVLVGVGQSGVGGGIQRFSAGAWKNDVLPEGNGSSLAVSAMLIDRDNGVWISTTDAGIYHVHQGRTDRFLQADGLSSDTVWNFFEDREGNVWTVTPRGMDQFRNLAVATLSKRQGLPVDVFGSVLAARDGTVWVGNGSSLASLREGRLSAVSAENGLPGKNVTALLEDHTARLWVGIDDGLFVVERGRFRPVLRSNGSPLGMITGLAEDTDQNLWALAIGKPVTLVRIRDAKVVEEIPLPSPVVGATLAADPKGGIWLGRANGDLTRYRAGHWDLVAASDGSGMPTNVFVDSDGSTWAGVPKGLVRWKDGKRRLLTTHNGLPCDRIFSMIKDNAGSLWLYAACGVMAIAPAELEKWWAAPDASIAVRFFDVLDGAQPGFTTFAPAASKSPDGRLWFASDADLQFIDPGRLAQNRLPPPVAIEQVVADGRSYVLEGNLQLPALTRNVQIDYTALSFSVPQKVRFRYKLEGWDERWQEPGTRRQAFYTDLSPRTYRFHIIAANNDGVWNETGASWSFSVARAYYQTAWFQVMAIAAGMLGLWALYRLRVRQIAAAMIIRFDERMAERNRLSGELHDTILQDVQASKMVADYALFDQSGDPASMRQAMETISGWLAKATSEGRAALIALRASTTLNNDLVEGFQRAAEVSRVNMSMDLVLHVDGATRELHPIVRDEVYRIGCEAIRNACLHSGGNRLEVNLSYVQDFVVRVHDNGHGIHPDVAASGKPGHFGLAGMQERAIRIGGRFRLLTRPNAGTEIELIVPGNVAFHDVRRSGIREKLRDLLRKKLGLGRRLEEK